MEILIWRERKGEDKRSMLTDLGYHLLVSKKSENGKCGNTRSNGDDKR